MTYLQSMAVFILLSASSIGIQSALVPHVTGATVALAAAGDATSGTPDTGKVSPIDSLNQTAHQAGLTASDSGGTQLPVIVANIINIVLGLLGIVAFILIIFAGFIRLTSAGNPEKIKRANGILINSVIGLAIIFSAAALTNFVVFRLLDVTGN